jgi:Pyruvate/2-oxoacid:ferredoxin oxidoreductase delta subunit
MDRLNTTTNFKILKQYNEDKTSLKCGHCNVFFSKDQCEIYETQSKKMHYPICPICKSKHPLRTRPRNTRWFRNRVQYKRIE